MVKNLLPLRETQALTPGSGRSPGEGYGNPLQYSCLENPMDRGAWRPAVHGVAKTQTQLSDWACIHTSASDRSLLPSEAHTSFLTALWGSDKATRRPQGTPKPFHLSPCPAAGSPLAGKREWVQGWENESRDELGKAADSAAD